MSSTKASQTPTTTRTRRKKAPAPQEPEVYLQANSGQETKPETEKGREDKPSSQPAQLFAPSEVKRAKAKVEKDKHVSLLLKPDLYERLAAEQKRQGAKSFNAFVTRLFEMYCDGDLVLKS